MPSKNGERPQRPSERLDRRKVSQHCLVTTSQDSSQENRASTRTRIRKDCCRRYRFVVRLKHHWPARKATSRSISHTLSVTRQATHNMRQSAVMQLRRPSDKMGIAERDTALEPIGQIETQIVAGGAPEERQKAMQLKKPSDNSTPKQPQVLQLRRPSDR